MKLFGNPKRMIITGLFSLVIIALGYGVRSIMVGNVNVAAERARQRERLASELYSEAMEAKDAGHTEEALKCLTRLQRKCPSTEEAAEGLVLLADMVPFDTRWSPMSQVRASSSGSLAPG